MYCVRPAKIKKMFLNHQNFKTDARARAFFFFFFSFFNFLRKCTLSTRDDRRLKPKQEQIRCKLWLEKSITSSSWKKVNPIFFIPHLFFLLTTPKRMRALLRNKYLFFFGLRFRLHLYVYLLFHYSKKKRLSGLEDSRIMFSNENIIHNIFV